MKKTCLFLALMVLMASLGGAHAAESLSGRIEGRTLYVTWNTSESGECTLTVSQNNWPICVRNVNAADGGMSLSLSEVSGSYTLRLKKADGGCLTATVTGEKPTPAPTEAPEPEPTSVCTQEPTEVDTPEPTGTPFAEATPEPTLVVTGAPTALPTDTPTPGITPEPTLAPASSTISTSTPAPTRSPMPTKIPSATARPIQTIQPIRTAPAVSWRDDLAAQVVDIVNDERAKQGLEPLVWSEELARAARVRGSEIAQVFSHTRPDGTNWSTVSASAYGENIAMGQRDAERVMASWMTSQGHRDNILRPGYGSIGVCACVSNGVVYWVQLFGK